MNESVLKKLAKPMLILAPIIWGTSFVVMKHSLDSFTPFYLLAIRFTAALHRFITGGFAVPYIRLAVYFGGVLKHCFCFLCYCKLLFIYVC